METRRIEFLKYAVYTYVAVALFAVLGLYAYFTSGLNMGIDFTGGVIIEAKNDSPVDLSSTRQVVATAGHANCSIQYIDSKEEVLIRMPLLNDVTYAEQIGRVKSALLSIYPALDIRKTDMVGAVASEQLFSSAMVSIALAIFVMFMYLNARFSIYYAIGAVFSLFHDALMILFVYIIFGYEFNLSSIAIFLTVIGYSLNDTVVIFDRMRENMKSRSNAKVNLKEIIELSINETLSRTIMTSLTTLIACVSLALFGGGMLHEFGLLMSYGVIIGTYSSVFIATSSLLLFDKQQFKRAQ